MSKAAPPLCRCESCKMNTNSLLSLCRWHRLGSGAARTVCGRQCLYTTLFDSVTYQSKTSLFVALCRWHRRLPVERPEQRVADCISELPGFLHSERIREGAAAREPGLRSRRPVSVPPRPRQRELRLCPAIPITRAVHSVS